MEPEDGERDKCSIEDCNVDRVVDSFVNCCSLTDLGDVKLSFVTHAIVPPNSLIILDNDLLYGGLKGEALEPKPEEKLLLQWSILVF